MNSGIAAVISLSHIFVEKHSLLEQSEQTYRTQMVITDYFCLVTIVIVSYIDLIYSEWYNRTWWSPGEVYYMTICRQL